MSGPNDVHDTAEAQRTQRAAENDWEENRWTEALIGAAIEVHRELGPGLLESTYEECLARELSLRGIPFETQKCFALHYKGFPLEAQFRIDLVVADLVIVEIKSVERVLSIHEAQLLTYLRLTNRRVGLLINFNVVVMTDGIRRKVRSLRPSASSASLR